MKTRVVNIRVEQCDVYIGRAGHGQDGYFGNPFRLGVDGDREEVLVKYKRWFWNRVNEDREFREKVSELEGKKLGCFCKPKTCHGDVILAWIEAGKPLRSEK